MSRILKMQGVSSAVDRPFLTTRLKERRTKAKIACTFCRIKKIKCEGGRPCPNCVDHKAECIYPAAQRQRIRVPEQEISSLRDRLSRVETLLSASNVAFSRTQASSALTASHNEYSIPPSPSLLQIPDGDFASATPLANIRTLPSTPVHTRSQQPPSSSTSSRSTLPTYSSEALTQLGRSEDDDDGSSFMPPEEELTFEYHGPGSFLSICSKSGVEWVQGRTGDKNFAKLARLIAHNVAQRLKLVKAVTSGREPEPSPDLSWKYVRAFFDETPESTLGIICRNSFESRLHSHLQQTSQMSSPESDAAWYALRFAVFAIGCRATLAKDSALGFRAAHEQSWKYFQNALSMYTELHFSRTGLMAVQALTIMSLYAEGIESPALDYMLVSSALKLAEAKGLHRQPATAWKLSDKAIQIRSSIWWFLYTFDRHIAFRSGRPLSVGDENINCQLPKLEPGGEKCFEVFISMATHAQISSQISTTITRLRSSNPNVKEVVSTITHLDQKLRLWRARLPPYIDFDQPFNADRLPPSVYPLHFFYLFFSYYGALMAIHSIIVQPWNAIAVQLCRNQSQLTLLNQQVQKSDEILVSASRKIIEQLPHVKIEPSTHKWLVLTFPLNAVLNLFVHVLQQPAFPSIESDINLMYAAAGHYSYLEFLLPDQRFPFVRELANVARKAVSEARANSKSKLKSTNNLTIPSSSSVFQSFGESFLTETLFYDTFQLSGSSMDDFNDEDWGTLLVRDDWSHESPLSLVPLSDTPMF
ncbi:uncharacterized protein PV09_03177 [Verruconis gallopava]|uniref:Zn(2)-C6 fungal-type domain-containing protein n=1 Tax=Verruconis gallopava TaxID=253628 RepID=A0A0D2B465_9PEZI|nr:uncharacterized protein PV09_03177 [Verruconis gallopava]KIW05994.1 hypothetical protein PV09_03177 [Verruconis gallopava]